MCMKIIIECVNGCTKLSNKTSISCQANKQWSVNLAIDCYKSKQNADIFFVHSKFKNDKFT